MMMMIFSVQVACNDDITCGGYSYVILLQALRGVLESKWCLCYWNHVIVLTTTTKMNFGFILQSDNSQVMDGKVLAILRSNSPS